jgi:hypothetical protein|tara:strand:- start:302 stop:517 length:216 start_codon:yes stop_codon:yes gene_type:complete
MKSTASNRAGPFRFRKGGNDGDKSQGAGSGLGTYTEFYQEKYDRKHDSVAESLYRIHDKLTRGKDRRRERI